MKMTVDDAYKKYFETWTDRKKPTPLPDNILVWSNTRGIAIRDLIPLDSGEGYMIGSGGEWLERPISGSDYVDVYALVEPSVNDAARNILIEVKARVEHFFGYNLKPEIAVKYLSSIGKVVDDYLSGGSNEEDNS